MLHAMRCVNHVCGCGCVSHDDALAWETPPLIHNSYSDEIHTNTLMRSTLKLWWSPLEYCDEIHSNTLIYGNHCVELVQLIWIDLFDLVHASSSQFLYFLYNKGGGKQIVWWKLSISHGRNKHVRYHLDVWSEVKKVSWSVHSWKKD